MLCALVLALDVYLNAAIQAWWAGGSFGMRRFVGDLPFMAPGIAAFGVWFIAFCRKRPLVPVTFLTLVMFLYNVTLVRQMREGYGPPASSELPTGLVEFGDDASRHDRQPNFIPGECVVCL